MRAILLRFTIQGVGLGAVGALVVGVAFAGPMMITLAGFIAIVGAIIGGPAGFAAGLGAALAARLSQRAIPVALGGAVGTAAFMGALVYAFGAFAPYGLVIFAVAVLGAAVLSPLTLRWMGPNPFAQDKSRLASWPLLAALLLEAASMLLLLPLIARTFSVSEVCREFGSGDAKESLFPPQITCFKGGEAVELISRNWYVLLAVLLLVATALTVLALVRMRGHGSADLLALSTAILSGLYALIIGVSFVVALAQPPVAYAEPKPASTPMIVPDPGEEEPIPLDPDAGMPDPVTVSTAFTVDALMAAMQQLADDSFAVAGPIDDPDIPTGIQTYPVQQEQCEAGGVRVVLDIWFATGHNEEGLKRIETYWASLGYTALSEPGHVSAAGREPLPAERLDLLQTWDEDDLRLRLTSLCVAGP